MEEDGPVVAALRDYVLPGLLLLWMIYYLFTNIVRPFASGGIAGIARVAER